MKLIRKILFVLLLMIFSKGIFAQVAISGQIIDGVSQHEVSEATIFIPELNKKIKTNKKGIYKIESIPAGDYLLEISAVNYTSIVKNVSVTDNQMLEIILYPAVIENTAVIVTGVGRATKVKESPIIITTTNKDFLNQNASSNIIDALSNIPGVEQISTGTAVSKPVIRGLGYNRVVTLFNGIRQEGQQWGEEHGIEIDANEVDKVEIIKGPGSLLYGSDAIAGVINFLSPRPLHEGEVKTEVVSQYQSNNQFIGTSIANTGNVNGLQWQGRISNVLAGNFTNQADGKVLNSGNKELDASLFLGINKNWGHTYFNISNFSNKIALPEGERDEQGKFIYVDTQGVEQVADNQLLDSYDIMVPYQKVNHFRVSNNTEFKLKNGNFSADLAYQKNIRKEFGNPLDPYEKSLYFDLNTYNYAIRYGMKKINNWENTFGVGGMYQTNDNKGLEFLIPEYQLFDIGVFGVTKKKLSNQLSISGGVRFDTRKISSDALYLDSDEQPTSSFNPSATEKFASLSKSFYGVSGSVGLAYLVSNISNVKLNFSRGYRAPTSSELSTNGIHEGAFKYEIGNPELKPELSHQIDLGYYLSSEHVTFECTPFINFISNYIYSEGVEDSMGNSILIDDAPLFQYTQNNAVLYGGELYLDFHPHPLDWLHIEQSFSYVRGKQDHDNLPFIPAPNYRIELRMTSPQLTKFLHSSYIKVGLNNYFKQSQIYSKYTTETSTPGYALVSMGIGTNIHALGRNDFLKIYLSGENLLDKKYQNHLSRLKYAPENPLTGETGIYNMGRNLSIKMILTL